MSARLHEEVSESERRYRDGSDPRVLDIIEVPLLRSQPKGYQSENWVLDPDQYWVRDGRATWEDLDALVDDPPTLWNNGSSSWNGSNDRVALDEADLLSTSLYLLHVRDVRLDVFAPGAGFGNPKRRVQAVFSHRGVHYWLWVTDPVIERAYLALPDGPYPIGECFATVSLGEPFEGYCYKLVAALIIPKVSQ